jgi:hypothetical protein
MGGAVGLDYQAVATVAEWMDAEIIPRVLRSIQVLERITLQMQADKLASESEKK